MLTYTVGGYYNGIAVYLTGVKEGTSGSIPQFSDNPEEAVFGNQAEVEQLVDLFNTNVPQYGPFQVVEVTLVDEEDDDYE